MEGSAGSRVVRGGLYGGREMAMDEVEREGGISETYGIGGNGWRLRHLEIALLFLGQCQEWIVSTNEAVSSFSSKWLMSL